MAKTKSEQGFEILPLMPLRGMILFPHATMDLDVGREQSIKAVEKAMESDQRIFVVPQKNMNVEDPKQGDMNPVGTIARIRQVLHITGSMLRVLVEGEHVPQAFLARTTPHQLGICDVLAAARLSDTMPKHLTLYGIEPKQLDVGIGLSPEVEAGMEKTIGAVVTQLRHFGYEVKPNGIQSEY